MSRIRDLSKLLKLVVHIISRTVQISYAGIYLLDKEDSGYNLEASRGKADKSVPTWAVEIYLIFNS